jgi:hypothetical protein
MRVSGILKKQLLQQVEDLSEERLQEVLDFVGCLRGKEQQASRGEQGNDLDPAKDPILKFIGKVSHGGLAKRIDEELYGE